MDELAAYFSKDDSPKTILPTKDLRCRTNMRKDCRYGALRRCSTDTAGICTMEKSWQEDMDGADKTTDAIRGVGSVANGFKPEDATSRDRTGSTNLVMLNHLPPEVEMGNIEYKRKLVDPTPNRFEHLVTQMKWRLNEGDGEAIYRLGVDDDGNISGLSPNELTPSLRTLTRMAHRLNATVKPLREWIVDPAICSDESLTPNAHVRGEHRKAVELLIRQLPTINQGKSNICIAVLGGVDAGKSTLIGVLTDGELDNGRGRARLNLFRHPHEVQSGRTSSLSSQLLGFDSNGNVLNYRRTDGRLERCSVEEVVQKSAQLVTLLDLAGLAKYQRTTLSGLSRTQPVGVLLVVSATTGLTSVGLEHAQLAISLGLPLGVVISKIDAVLDTTDRARHVRLVYSQILQRIKQLRLRVPFVPDFEALRDPSPTEGIKSMKKYDYMIPPFFPVSCVSGEGLDQLARFLSRLGRTAVHTRSIDPQIDVPSPLPSANGLEKNPLNFFCDSPSSTSSSDSDSTNSHENCLTKEDCFVSTVNSSLAATNRARNSRLICFWVNQVFEHIPGVPDPVLYGKIQSGQLNINQFAWLGPDQFGEFHLVRVVSLMHNRLPHSVVYAGQTASVAVHFIAGSTLDYDSDRKVKTQPDHPIYSGHRQYYKAENDENVPKDTDSSGSPNSSTSTTPVILRRGMVLISHQSWSTNYGSLLNLDNPLPFRLPRCIGVNSSVGVAWTVGLALTHLLPASPTVSGSPAALPTLPLLNQQVTVYAGCVAQSAVVLAESETGPPVGEHSNNAHIAVRFVRRPEYLEVNRRIILTWASCAKAVGYISSLRDLVTRERPFSCSNLDVDGTKSDLFSCGEQPVEALRSDPKRPLRGTASLPSAISRAGHLDEDRILPTRFPLRHRQTDGDACSGGDGNHWITSPDLTLPSTTVNRLLLEDPRTSAKLALLNEDSPEDGNLTPADVQSEHLIAVDGSELDSEIRRDESSPQSYLYTRRRRRHQSDVF
ncbi:unnamed protein product [Calicophoron daubneyi]|uniref:Tr-type G domain-containing protein n=1 Tax=Calicophoron daubneyi TaxID=300641 RepID=A0AAV2TIW0_CALDB